MPGVPGGKDTRERELLVFLNAAADDELQA